MLRNGLYRVAFQTPLGAGAGVVFLQNGRLWGGDSALFYVGHYSVIADQFRAEVSTNRHTEHPGVLSVFGIDRVHIALRGKATPDSVRVSGSATEAPGIKFEALLSRLSD